MGYTHYFRAKKPISDAAWVKIKKDLIKLYNTYSILGERLYSDYLQKYIEKPEDLFCIINDVENSSDGKVYEAISVNGDRELDLDHETFFICKESCGEQFNFTKTNRKPYDIFVAAAGVIIYNHAASSVYFSSDGSLADEEWLDAISLLDEAFPKRKIKLPKFLGGHSSIAELKDEIKGIWNFSEIRKKNGMHHDITKERIAEIKAESQKNLPLEQLDGFKDLQAGSLYF